MGTIALHRVDDPLDRALDFSAHDGQAEICPEQQGDPQGQPAHRRDESRELIGLIALGNDLLDPLAVTHLGRDHEAHECIAGPLPRAHLVDDSAAGLAGQHQRGQVRPQLAVQLDQSCARRCKRT